MRSGGVAVDVVGAPAGARGKPPNDAGFVGTFVVAVPKLVGAIGAPSDALPPEFGVVLLVGVGHGAGEGGGSENGSPSGIVAGLVHGSLSLPPRGGG